MPRFIRSLYSHFPLHYHPPIVASSNTPRGTKPVLWITPPLTAIPSNVLSSDVECLKWQAYIALRGINDVCVRWDVDSAGGVDGRLPSLWVPASSTQDTEKVSSFHGSPGELLSARMIPGWADEMQGEHTWSSDLEGYVTEQARDESRAWVSLLEGIVHAALVSRVHCLDACPPVTTSHAKERYPISRLRRFSRRGCTPSLLPQSNSRQYSHHRLPL